MRLVRARRNQDGESPLRPAASCRQLCSGHYAAMQRLRLRITGATVQTWRGQVSSLGPPSGVRNLSLGRSPILSGLFSYRRPRLLKLAIRSVKAHGLRIMDKRTRQDRLARHLNVERYRRLLKYATDEDRRRHLQELLAGEQQKQKDAGDPKHPY
jgi:hypothetical protein